MSAARTGQQHGPTVLLSHLDTTNRPQEVTINTQPANYAHGYTDRLYTVHCLSVTTRRHASGVVDHYHHAGYVSIAITPNGRRAFIESIADGHSITGDPVTIDGVDGHEDYLTVIDSKVTEKAVYVVYVDNDVTRVVHGLLV